MTTQTSIGKIVLYVLAAIGVVAVLGCVGMWVMHKSMMGQLRPQAVVAELNVPSRPVYEVTGHPCERHIFTHPSMRILCKPKH